MRQTAKTVRAVKRMTTAQEVRSMSRTRSIIPGKKSAMIYGGPYPLLKTGSTTKKPNSSKNGIKNALVAEAAEIEGPKTKSQ